MPSASDSSLSVLASPSAASHSRKAKPSRRLAITRNIPPASRTATMPASADTRMSGRGVFQADSDAQRNQRSAGPAQRRSQQAHHDKSGSADQQRTDAEGRDPPDRAGQACDPGRHRDHPVDALAHQPPERPVEAERHRDQTQKTGRHHPDRDRRHREQIGEHAIRREPVEMVGGEQRCCGACNQRRHDQAPRFHARPRARSVRQRACRARPTSLAARAHKPRSAQASPQTTSGSSDARSIPERSRAAPALRRRSSAASTPAGRRSHRSARSPS